MNAAALTAVAADSRIDVAVADIDDESWDRFVDGCPAATVFHRMAWRRVLEETYGYRAHYLVARRGAEIVGVLPLFELGSRRRPRCLLSLPFAVDGGVCAIDDAAQQALAAASVELAAGRRVAAVELRDCWQAPGFCDGPTAALRFRRALGASDDETMAAIPRKQRRMVRVGQQAGLQSRIEEDGTALLHHLASQTLRRLGSPVFPLAHYRSLRRHLGSSCEILSVWRDSTPVAAVMSFYFAGSVMPYYVGSMRDASTRGVNDFLYWELMRRARERGATDFDFGRSRPGSGAHAYKMHWGFTPEPVRSRVHVAGGAAAPSGPGAAVELARRWWRHVPLPVAKAFGPMLMKHIGVYHT